MRWFTRIALVLLAIAVLPGARWHVQSEVVSAQPPEKVVVRSAPESCAQTIERLGLTGKDVNCKEPPAPSYEPPRINGPYRLIAPFYVGTLTYEDTTPTDAPAGVATDDINVLVKSPIYRAPAFLPEGYRLASMSTGEGDSQSLIRSTYVGPGPTITIGQIVRYLRPIDIDLPPEDSDLVIEATQLEGKPAILSYHRPGSLLERKGLTAVRYVDGFVETIVRGDGLALDNGIRIARSLICGDSCPHMSPASSPAPAPLNSTVPGDVPDSAIESTPGSPTPTGSGAPAGDTYRVASGLQGPCFAVDAFLWYPPSGYWHGNEPPHAYNEAALDLVTSCPEWDPTPGHHVQLWAQRTGQEGWGGPLFMEMEEYQLQPSWCTGRYIHLYDAGWNDLGRLTYVHMIPYLPPGNRMAAEYTDDGWFFAYIGEVIDPEPDSDCPWQGAHLHQGADHPDDHILPNYSLGGHIEPTNDWENDFANRLFDVTLVDSDGDGCSDSKEAAMGFNASTGWYDFYDVPVPVTADPQPNGTKNKAVNMLDVLAVLRYVGTFNGDNGVPNANGVAYDSVKRSCEVAFWEDSSWHSYHKEGVCYDRSPSTAPNPPYDAGPPNGAISMSDVLIALAQVGLNCN